METAGLPKYWCLSTKQYAVIFEKAIVFIFIDTLALVNELGLLLLL
jgi:hypothetical protein